MGILGAVPSHRFSKMRRLLSGETLKPLSISPLEGEMSRQGQRGVRGGKENAARGTPTPPKSLTPCFSTDKNLHPVHP
ncbi:hypothetical protein GGR23_003749, partial [Gellertiella hungarica]|nr:hypothetical protein [Gellertiella hungarica]